MQQFIRYLYEYDNGKRVRNIGFVKVEKQEDKCTMHIHGKGVEFGTDRKIEVFVFFAMSDINVRVSQGSVDNTNPIIHFILKFEAEDMGGQEAFEAMRGVILENNTGKRYVAVWDNADVDVDGMLSQKEWEQSQATPEEQPEMPEPKPEVVQPEMPEPKPDPEPMREMETDEYIPQPERTYEKISRQDLARLPRKEWRLANNSFLLHGFYNYHHLLYIKEGENCWIGVPGIYHEKEQAAARAFGFPQFHRITDGVLELSDEETNTYEDFGYWCRSV